MNWGELKARVLRRIHDTSKADNVPDWYSEVQQEMLAVAQWRHLDADKVLPTTAPHSTGTASATNGSTTVTFTSTLPASIAGQLISIGGHYYKIASRTDDTHLELDSKFIGTTGSGLAFQIIFYQLDMPSDFSPPRLYEATIQTGDGVYPLRYATERDLFEEDADESRTLGHPTMFRFFGGKMQLWPPPDGAYNVKVFYHRTPSEPTTSSVDATTLDWPADLQSALYQGVLAVGFEDIDDSLAVSCRRRFEAGLLAAVNRNNRAPSAGNSRLKRWDRCASAGRAQYRLPEPIG